MPAAVFIAAGRRRPMPGFDGTGPRGKGPMTGWARGYCVLRESNDPSNHVQGFAGVQGMPVDVELPEAKEVTVMPLGNGVGPLASRPLVGRSAQYHLRGYANPVPMGAVSPVGVYGVAPYSYRWPWWARFLWRPLFGRGFGRGRGRGRGRGCGQGRFGVSW